MSEVPLPPTQPSQPAAAPAQSAADVAAQISASSTYICPQCHFPLKPEYYFCPNCGKNLRSGGGAPLGTDTMSQVLLYGFSIILPFIAYLAITKWQGIKYMRSSDEKARQMGYIALALLIISSIVVFWWTYVWINSYIQSSLNDFNTNFSGLGGGL